MYAIIKPKVLEHMRTAYEVCQQVESGKNRFEKMNSIIKEHVKFSAKELFQDLGDTIKHEVESWVMSVEDMLRDCSDRVLKDITSTHEPLFEKTMSVTDKTAIGRDFLKSMDQLTRLYPPVLDSDDFQLLLELSKKCDLLSQPSLQTGDATCSAIVQSTSNSSTAKKLVYDRKMKDLSANGKYMPVDSRDKKKTESEKTDSEGVRFIKDVPGRNRKESKEPRGSSEANLDINLQTPTVKLESNSLAINLETNSTADALEPTTPRKSKLGTLTGWLQSNTPVKKTDKTVEKFLPNTPSGEPLLSTPLPMPILNTPPVRHESSTPVEMVQSNTPLVMHRINTSVPKRQLNATAANIQPNTSAVKMEPNTAKWNIQPDVALANRQTNSSPAHFHPSATAANIKPNSPTAKIQPNTTAAKIQTNTLAANIQANVPSANIQVNTVLNNASKILPSTPAKKVKSSRPVAKTQSNKPAARIQPSASAANNQPNEPTEILQSTIQAAKHQPNSSAASLQPAKPAAKAQPSTPAVYLRPNVPSATPQLISTAAKPQSNTPPAKRLPNTSVENQLNTSAVKLDSCAPLVKRKRMSAQDPIAQDLIVIDDD